MLKIPTDGSIRRLARLTEKPNKTKRERDVVRYYSKLYRATPSWLGELDKRYMRALYRYASARGMAIDHIVPLSNPLVCGLHVPDNLQLMSLKENQAKSNHFWPDMPGEQMKLFGDG